MAVYNEKDKKRWTKDGRHWYYVCYYVTLKGIRKQFKSKMFLTKQEAETEELKFKIKRDNPTLVKFSVVANEYFNYMYKSKKESTVYSYENAYKKI